LGHQR
jgi:hypothetical protein